MRDLPKCGVEGCPGHLGKFDSCVAEAMYEWTLDGDGDGSTGTTEYEGYVTLFIVESDESVTIDPDGENRTVTVPAGNYVLHSADSGAVSPWTYDTPEAARAEFNGYDERYGEWLGDDE